MIILGDFNLHVDNNVDCYSKRFTECLQFNGLIQHVKALRHTSGHALDLIITRKTDKFECFKTSCRLFYLGSSLYSMQHRTEPAASDWHNIEIVYALRISEMIS